MNWRSYPPSHKRLCYCLRTSPRYIENIFSPILALLYSSFMKRLKIWCRCAWRHSRSQAHQSIRNNIREVLSMVNGKEVDVLGNSRFIRRRLRQSYLVLANITFQVSVAVFHFLSLVHVLERLRHRRIESFTSTLLLWALCRRHPHPGTTRVQNKTHFLTVRPDIKV